jgi:hypothetical protein
VSRDAAEADTLPGVDSKTDTPALGTEAPQ